MAMMNHGWRRAANFRCVLIVSVPLVACGGQIIDDVDASDAAPQNDASTSDAQFVCGEGNTFVICNPGDEFCRLIRTSTSHHYSCVPNDGVTGCMGSPPASQGDCGCFIDANGDVYITQCP
jgi:hypothetical protein